jgi:hypothetical protein
MAFVTNASGNVIAFSDSFDVRDIEQRVFEANEINFSDAASPAFNSLDEYIDNLCEKSMSRILLKFKASSWWRTYTGSGPSDLADLDPDKIKSRQQDFTDMSVYYVLKEYILPKAADFGIEEVRKWQKSNTTAISLRTCSKNLLQWLIGMTKMVMAQSRMVKSSQHSE